MKKAYVPKRFSPESSLMIQTINGILDEYIRAGYDLSLRQLYYQLVARDIVPNTERSYKNIGNLVSEARLAGYIDWDVIKDRGRETVERSHWDSPRDIIEACVQSYHIDMWEEQRHHVEVMVEKQALEGVLIPICQKWDVPFSANKGYTSSSFAYEAGRRLLNKICEDKYPIIIYLGDHDPSGIDMTRDVQERMRLFTEYTDGDRQCVDVHRIALNMDQVKKLNPPENPAKITDPRADDYISKFGRKSWELDAIEPKKLAKLVEDAIKLYIDDEKWEEAEARKQKGKDALRKMANEYNEED